MGKIMKILLDVRNTTENIDLQNNSEQTVINYGVRSRYADLPTLLTVISTDDLEFQSTCGCSTVQQEKSENAYSLNVKYNAEVLGNFGKTLKINDKKTGNTVHEIILRGTIVK